MLELIGGAFLLAVAVLGFGYVVEEAEGWFWGTVWTIVAACGGVYLLGLTPKFKAWWAAASAFDVVGVVVLYVFAGILWSMFKMWSTTRNTTRREFARAAISTSMNTPEEHAEECKKNLFDRIFNKVPGWIAFWPSSFIWDLASKWLKDFFVMIADALEYEYKRIFERALKHIKD